MAVLWLGARYCVLVDPTTVVILSQLFGDLDRSAHQFGGSTSMISLIITVLYFDFIVVNGDRFNILKFNFMPNGFLFLKMKGVVLTILVASMNIDLSRTHLSHYYLVICTVYWVLESTSFEAMVQHSVSFRLDSPVVPG